MVEPLQTLTAREILEMVFEEDEWLVEGFLPPGMIILAGSPKSGKSWLAALLSLSVSLGTPFLGMKTTQAGVLYLALEDNFKRVQRRLFRIIDEANDDFDLAVIANNLKGGLIEQIEMFLAAKPRTRLVIIDTFQTVRGESPDNSYSADYNDIRLLKQLAYNKDIALMLIHHTRKMVDENNVFNNILGGNGIIGAVDEAMVLTKASAHDKKATLSITGKDVADAEYKLLFKDCKWELIGITSPEEMEERSVPAAVLTVLDFMAGRAGNWEGTATELVEQAGVADVKSNVLTKYLNQHSSFLQSRGIGYQFKRTASARLITLVKSIPNEAN